MIRDDISPEANIARRKFWEMCASRTPIFIEETDSCEDASDMARWADYMLVEWDKRWIEEDNTTQANEILP